MADPLLPLEIRGSDCLKIAQALRYYGFTIPTDSIKANVRELVRATLALNKTGLRISDYARLIQALSSLSFGQLENNATKVNALITHDMSIEERIEMIKVAGRLETDWLSFAAEAKKFIAKRDMASLINFSRVFPDSWEEFCKQISELLNDSMNEDQRNRIVERASKILRTNRKEVRHCTKLLCDKDTNAEDVLEVMKCVDSIPEGRENITRIVLRHPEIASFNAKCKIIKALPKVLHIEEIDDVITHASLFLNFDNPDDAETLLKSVTSIKTEDRRNLCTALVQNFGPSSFGRKLVPTLHQDFDHPNLSIICGLINVLSETVLTELDPEKQTAERENPINHVRKLAKRKFEIEDLARHTKTICKNNKKLNPVEVMAVIATIPQDDRESIMNAVNCVTEDNTTLTIRTCLNGI